MDGDVNLKLSDKENRFGIVEKDSRLPAQDAKDGSQSAASGDLLDPSTVPLAVSPTPAGPRRPSPAGNALWHGLTATTFLPDTLRLRTDHLAAELRRELRPVGVVQLVLVDEIARHAAGMELAGHAEGSILRYCGQQQAQLDLLLDGDGPINADAIVTAAVSSQPLERLGRYRRLHERGFHTALSRLRDLQATRQESHTALNSRDFATNTSVGSTYGSAPASRSGPVPAVATATGTGWPASAGNAARAAFNWASAGAV